MYTQYFHIQNGKQILLETYSSNREDVVDVAL